MREFIVWDEDRKVWIDETRCVFEDGTLYRNDRDYEDGISDDLTMFEYIGKSDINDRKIYADSSIVEFNVKSFGWDYETVFRGFFTFSEQKLCYELETFARFGNINLIFSRWFREIKNLKIIDTIQERKDRNANSK